jgi:CheY-like chemotaxis protein
MELFNEVLLVDDDNHTVFFNKVLLEETKFTKRVHLALDGEEALQLIKEGYALKNEDYSGTYLILLDIKMPVMGGFEFLEHLAGCKDLTKEKIHVVLLTSLTDRYYDEKAKGFKIATILNKPLTAEKLKVIMRELAKGEVN